MSIFEIIMLLCFGAAWPFSIFNSWRSKSTKGKSVIFLITLMIGYIAGIINKIYYSYDAVIYLYILNLVMVMIDTCLWVRNRRIEREGKKPDSILYA